MDFDLTDEQQLIKQTAREFTDKEIVVQSRENARNHHFDLEIVKKLANQGYLGAIVPTEYGGAGLDYLSYGLVVEEIGRGCSSVRTVVSVQTSLVCSAFLRWGTEEQKHKYLPKLCSGEWLGCFGLTEPDTGSDAANQKTRAKKTDTGWVINGAKMWISMGNYAKVALIFAQTDPALGYKGLGCFLVDTDQAGYKPAPIEHKMGLHASDTASIALEDVEVPEDALLGTIGDGFKIAMSSLDSGRYSVAAGCVGICQGCVEESVKYAKEREQFGKVIGSFQAVKHLCADMLIRAEVARVAVYAAAVTLDGRSDDDAERAVAAAKCVAGNAAIQNGKSGIQVHGGNGYTWEFDIGRYWKRACVLDTQFGNSDEHALHVAEMV